MDLHGAGHCTAAEVGHQPVDTTQQRRFSRARRTDDENQFAFRQVQAHILQDRCLRAGICVSQMLELNHETPYEQRSNDGRNQQTQQCGRNGRTERGPGQCRIWVVKKRRAVKPRPGNDDGGRKQRAGHDNQVPAMPAIRPVDRVRMLPSAQPETDESPTPLRA